MSDITFEYEFDPYGENANNLISKEAHTITAANGTNFNFIVPRYAPFFRRSFVCRNLTTGGTLRPSIDYFFGFRFDQVIVSGSSLPVYGAIVFNDPALTANVEIDYQTLGGEFVQSQSAILALMANKVNDPRTLQWSAVVNLPTEFPPIAHRHDVSDVTTFSDVISAIYDLSDAQKMGFNKAMQSLMEHINDHNNPHRITLADLGIDDLGSLIPATQDDAENGTDNIRYMTALRVSQSMTSLFLPILQQHEDDTSNPHQTTAAQVGLGLVSNYRVATTLEASAGVATNLYMTPAGSTLLAQTIVPVIMAPHTSNLANPHQTTAAQVGLGNVANYPIATDEVAVGGISRTAYMTPYATSLMMQNGSQQALAAHLADMNNPHQTTATQVGLGNVNNFGIASDTDAIAGVSKTAYMTPYATALLMRNGSQQDLTAHINDKNNPHAVTATQVGLGNVGNYGFAADADAQAASSTVLYLNPHGLGTWWTSVAKVYVDNAIALATNLTAEDVGLGDVVNAGFASPGQNTTGTATQVYVDPAGVTSALGANVISRNYSANPQFMANLADGFPAGALLQTGTKNSTGTNSTWECTLRTISSPLQDNVSVSVLLVDAPATYLQSAYVDVTSAIQIPGFIFGEFTDAGGLDNYAAIMFKSGSVYLGVYNGTTWTNGTAVALAGLTGASTLVSCTIVGTNMAVTVGSTTVNVNISSVTFDADNFASTAGFVVNGFSSLTFTPVSVPTLTTSLIDISTPATYAYANGAWTVDTTTALPAGVATDIRPGRILTNATTGEAFVVVDTGLYFPLAQPQLN